jgi:hypothetical protein
MLLLENLTPHQMEKYGQVEAALRSGQRVDIRAPAGAGSNYTIYLRTLNCYLKTFKIKEKHSSRLKFSWKKC